MSSIGVHAKEQAIDQLTKPAESLSDMTDTEKQDAATTPSTLSVTDWNGPNDPDNPHNWPLWQRVYHATTPGFFGFAV
jgi:hypothetical protein